MIENAPPDDARNQDFWKILPGLLISLIALGILFYIVDWQEFGMALRHANYGYLLLSLPIYLLSYLTRSRAWQITLLEEAPFKKVFLIQQAGYLLNNILPFRMGELGRSYLLGRDGLGFWRVFSSIFVERAFDLLLAVGLLLGTLPYVVEIPGARKLTAAVGVIVLIALLVMYTLACKQDHVLSWFERLGPRWPRLVELGRDRLESFLMGLASLANPVRFLSVFGWMAVSWILAVFVQFFVLRAYVPDAQVLWAAFALGVAALGVAIPSSPGAIGVYEAAFVGALALVGVPYSQALAYALTTHVMYYIFTGIFGAYALSQEGESLTALFQAIRKQPTKS